MTSATYYIAATCGAHDELTIEEKEHIAERIALVLQLEKIPVNRVTIEQTFGVATAVLT